MREGRREPVLYSTHMCMTPYVLLLMVKLLRGITLRQQALRDWSKTALDVLLGDTAMSKAIALQLYALNADSRKAICHKRPSLRLFTPIGLVNPSGQCR